MAAKAEQLEYVPCPYCGERGSDHWAVERGFNVVRCSQCALLYVNPRLPLSSIDQAVKTGTHGDEAQGLHVAARRVGSKVRYYEKWLGAFFQDVWAGSGPIAWLDIGAGYGELLEAVSRLAMNGSRIEGLEPMGPKAEAARKRGLNVRNAYLSRSHPPVQFVSFVDVFSHVPDFRAFLDDILAVLMPGGEIFMETGNLADLARREDFPGELGVPDHLVFAGESQLRGFLYDAGFEILRLHRVRVDGAMHFAKSAIKKVLGRPVPVRLPYTSEYRQLLLRARLRVVGSGPIPPGPRPRHGRNVNTP